MTQRVPLKLRFSGPEVDEHGLDLYDGATSFYGFAQALQMVVHARLNNEVVTRATALNGAKMQFSSPRQGSVLFDIVGLIEQNPVTGAAGLVVTYDFIKFSLSKAIGLLNVEPETATVKKLEDTSTIFDELGGALEGSLQRAHRSVGRGVDRVTLERSRGVPLVVFNQSTSDWVNTRNENPDIVEFTGNVTRYNSITYNGRAYIDQLQRIIPFKLGDGFVEQKRGLLTWSLHGNAIAKKNQLRFYASNIESASGVAKRLILANCDQMTNL